MKKTKEPRIIFFDIETTPMKTFRFQYDRNPYINHNDIIEDWYIVCAAWQVLGEKKVHSVAITKLGDDKQVVKALRDALATADVIMGHCIDRFDIRNLQARMVYHRITPLPNIPTLDTLKMARKIGGFTSNKLDYLAKKLLGAGKIKTDGDLWRQVTSGSKKALKDMVEYNKVDVIRNVEVYNVLRPYMPNHPHIGVMKGLGKNESCPNCGSLELKKNGIRPTKGGILKQEVQCKKCGSYHRIPVVKV